MFSIRKKLENETLECDCCQVSFLEGFFLYPSNDEEWKLACKKFKYLGDYREALFVCFDCLQEVTKSFGVFNI